MPERAALIAVLIMDRPLCLPCVSAKSGLGVATVSSYLDRMTKTVTVHRATDERCTACGVVTSVVALTREE
jgi:hypothetical protein